MSVRKTVYVCVTISAFLLMSCGSSSELMHPAHQSNLKPGSRFIDGVTVSGGTTQVATEIGNNKCPVEDPRKYLETFPGGKYLQSKYSGLLNVEPQAIRSLKLYTFIDEWYGVKHCMGGTSKMGIDCSAFVQQLYDSVFRINLVRTSFDQFNSVTYVWQKNDLREGDLVFFRTHGKHISHVGVYLMNGYFVHASNDGVMISSLNEEYWSRRFAGAGFIEKPRS